jgi:alanyl-tRNA synthetase
MYKLLPKLVDLFGHTYSELPRAEDFVSSILKQEEERLAEQKRKEDEEIKANQERIAQKLKEEEEAKELERKAQLDALAKIKEEEELNATKIISQPIDITTMTQEEIEKIAEPFGDLIICPTSKIDVEEDEKKSLSDNVIFAESIARQPFVKEEQVKTPAYNEMLKELFEREIVWFVQNNAVVTEEQLAITLASIVEKQKHIIL